MSRTCTGRAIRGREMDREVSRERGESSSRKKTFTSRVVLSSSVSMTVGLRIGRAATLGQQASKMV